MGNYNIMSFDSMAKQLNNLTFTFYYNWLMQMARSLFVYKGLPEGIKSEWIEKFLYYEGECAFFKDKIIGEMVTKCTDYGGYNNYDEPVKLRVYGTNYQAKELTNGKDVVMIKNNVERIPTSKAIKLFAWRLTEATRTIDVNITAQKTPIIIRCTDKQKNTLKQMFQQYNDNEIKIMVDKSLDPTSEIFEVLKTNAPIVFDKLQLQKHAIWNEVMTFMGINNANQDKKERLVDDEVQANNEQVEYSANTMLQTRKQACEEINKMFKLNISVEMVDLSKEFEKFMKADTKKEEEKEGAIND